MLPPDCRVHRALISCTRITEEGDIDDMLLSNLLDFDVPLDGLDLTDAQLRVSTGTSPAESEGGCLDPSVKSLPPRPACWLVLPSLFSTLIRRCWR